jgi:hypothetical protein
MKFINVEELPVSKMFEERSNFITESLQQTIKEVNIFSLEREVELIGRGPIYVYGALIHALYPAQVWVKDARLGEIKIRDLKVSDNSNSIFHIKKIGGYVTRLTVRLSEECISVQDMENFVLPKICKLTYLQITGEMPVWLYLCIQQTYQHMCQSVAVYVPTQKAYLRVVNHTSVKFMCSITKVGQWIPEKLTCVGENCSYFVSNNFYGSYDPPKQVCDCPCYM